MRLGLGTAQFGLDYGISNVRGKISLQEGRKILELAWQVGMRIIDTAPSYGDSESALGELVSSSEGFQIVTKTRPSLFQGITIEEAKEVEATFHSSLIRLRQERIYGFLVHHAEDLIGIGGEFLVDVLQSLRRLNLVEKIGVSVYSADQIDRVLKLFAPDIIQLPLNVFDQRLARSGHLRMLKDLGIEIHARSIFLQGLLLINPGSLHPYFKGVQSHVLRYHDYLASEGLTPLETAVQFVLQHPEIDVALAGVTAVSELQEIIDACGKESRVTHDWQSFAVQDETVLNPSLWRLAR